MKYYIRKTYDNEAPYDAIFSISQTREGDDSIEEAVKRFERHLNIDLESAEQWLKISCKEKEIFLTWKENNAI